MPALKHTLIGLSVFVGANLLPLPHSLICPAPAWGTSVRSYGQDGQTGRNGRDGQPGRDGPAQTIFATGSPFNLNLSGGDGTNGEDGADGQSANCGNQPQRVNYNVQGANGGGGGRGGDGGSGGNGGGLTVYYTNPADLRQIYAQAQGGRGGLAGRGGYGGYGCNCQQRWWEQQTCSGQPGTSGYRCRSERFSCTDGRAGQRGNDGNGGQSGQLGQLTLIPQLEPLPPENPSLNQPLSRFNNQVTRLSRNLWNLRRGALALLAPGSLVADEYREFAGRAERDFQLVWNAPRPISDFGSEAVVVELQNDQRLDVSVPPAVWLDATLDQQPNQVTYTVHQAVRESEATRLDIGGVAGGGAALTLAVVDLAGQSDVLSTQFRLRYQTVTNQGDRRPTYRTQFEGEIPADLVGRDYNRFTLALGQLPIDSRYLTVGTEVSIELTAIRSLGDRSAEQKIDWQGTVRPAR